MREPEVAIQTVHHPVVVRVALLPTSLPVKAFANQIALSRLSTTPSRLKSPAYVAITFTWCDDVSSSQPNVKPVDAAVESWNWPTSQWPPSQLAAEQAGDRRRRIRSAGVVEDQRAGLDVGAAEVQDATLRAGAQFQRSAGRPSCGRLYELAPVSTASVAADLVRPMALPARLASTRPPRTS